MFLRSRRDHEAGDRAGELLPPRALGGEPRPSLGGEAVHPNAPIVLGRSPLGADGLLTEQALEGGIERPRLDLEHVAGLRANELGEAVAVAWAPAERLEHDEIERALQQLHARRDGFLGHGLFG